MTAQPSKRQGH
ncbi:hypothetical protein SUNI508_01809 [Seiridium unicorne]|uniref:Uncharacterized protein n=1 Tax=Seiridium unicorne TaxID=138068 RepID=A0ABR2UP49_9PEZI